MAGYIIYPIGVMTNSFMRKVVNKLVDQEAVNLYVAMGDGGTIPGASPNPTLDTDTMDVGKMNNEYYRMAGGMELATVTTENDSILFRASFVVTADLNGNELNEIGVFDDLHAGNLMFYGWPSGNKSRFSMAEYTLATDDVITFKLLITPIADVF